EAQHEDVRHHEGRAQEKRSEAELAEERAKRARAEAELDERRAAERQQEGRGGEGAPPPATAALGFTPRPSGRPGPQTERSQERWQTCTRATQSSSST